VTPFLLMSEFRDHYLGLGKHGRAVALVARFPNIGWKLPAKRKPWDSEHYSMSIFEALAIATYGVGISNATPIKGFYGGALGKWRNPRRY